MADERLRRIEREAQSGDIDAQARLLRERVRVGELNLERVRLAAHCGHSVAGLALGERALTVPSPATGEEFFSWTGTLALWGAEALVRAAIAAARCVLPIFEDQYPLNTSIRRAVIHCENWLACPCEKHTRAAGQASRNAYWAHIQADMPAQAVGTTVSAASNCISNIRVIRARQQPSEHATHYAILSVNAAVAALQSQLVYSSICESLIEWSLRIRDPILDLRTIAPGQF